MLNLFLMSVIGMTGATYNLINTMTFRRRGVRHDRGSLSTGAVLRETCCSLFYPDNQCNTSCGMTLKWFWVSTNLCLCLAGKRTSSTSTRANLRGASVVSSPCCAQVFHQVARAVGNGPVLKALPCVGNFSAILVLGHVQKHSFDSAEEGFVRDSGSPPDFGVACDVVAMVVSPCLMPSGIVSGHVPAVNFSPIRGTVVKRPCWC